MKILVPLLIIFAMFGHCQNIVPMNSFEIWDMYGYPNENHVFQDPSGFILTMIRVPGNPGQTEPGQNGPILIIPGLGDESSTVFMQGPERSFPFRLTQQGYDVWIMNTRATKPSRAHVDASPDGNAETCLNSDPYNNPCELGMFGTQQYFNFSYDQIGQDIMDLHRYISEQTGYGAFPVLWLRDGWLYLGAGMSLNSEYFSQHATVAIQSSPTVLVSNSPALGGLMNSDSLFLLNIMDMLGFGLIAGNECQTMIMRMICQYLPVFWVISNSIGMRDSSIEQYDIPAFLRTINSPFIGLTVRIFIHNAQVIWDGAFRRYDYGSQRNLQEYGSEIAPIYPLNDVNVPVALFFSTDDITVVQEDRELLIEDYGENVVFQQLYEANHDVLATGNEESQAPYYDDLFEILAQYPSVQ